MSEGISRQREVNGLGGQSLGTFLNYLGTHTFDHNREHIEILIDPRKNSIHTEDLERLTRLPFEVSLSEHKGQVLLDTGVEGCIPWRSLRHQEAALTSRFALHTHPVRGDSEESYDSPSVADLGVAVNMAPHVYYAVVHRTGITVFRAPQRHPLTLAPLTKALVHDTLEELFETYMHRLKISALYPTPDGFRPHSDLSWRECAALQRSFAAACGSIVDEAGWHERKKLQALLRPLNAGPRG